MSQVLAPLASVNAHYNVLGSSGGENRNGLGIESLWERPGMQ